MATLVVLISIGVGHPLHAQFRLNIQDVADDAFPAAPVVAPVPERNLGQRRAVFNVDQNIDAWLFQRHRTEAAARTYLRKQLTLAIESITRNAQLEDGQKQKLELAGEGDISQFFAEVETIRAEFSDDQLNMNNGNDINKVFQRIQPLQQRMQITLFGPGSIFARVSKGILEESQQSELEKAERKRLKFYFDASLKNAISKAERTTPLRTAQRKRIIELVSESEPPLKAGRQLSNFALYRLAEIKPQLDEILEKHQLKAMEQLLAQGARMERLLRREGYLK